MAIVPFNSPAPLRFRTNDNRPGFRHSDRVETAPPSDQVNVAARREMAWHRSYVEMWGVIARARSVAAGGGLVIVVVYLWWMGYL